MRRLFAALLSVAALGGLAACQTATPYQPATTTGRYATGFSDFRIDDSHWKVTFRGNSLTSRETVERYLLYRAAELTVQQGGDWFETTDRQTERHSSFVGVGGDPFYSSGFGAAYGWGWRPAWRYYGPRGWIGWSPWAGDPFWADSVDIQQIDRYETTAEIAIGKGPQPDHKVFDARQVMANLGPSIVRPVDKAPKG